MLHVPKLSQFQALTEDEVKHILLSMTSKSCEQDAVPTKLLKDILPSVIPIITNIVNISLTEGLYSYQWKTAIIRPLLKKSGLELIPSNYRPVSNLSFLSKVVEKAALNQFTRHCDAHRLMPDYQSAYQRYYSCETALVKLVNDLLWNLENQNITMLTAIDLSAAFDTVDHGVWAGRFTKTIWNRRQNTKMDG